MNRKREVLLIGALLALTGCASRGWSTGKDASARTVISVENHNWATARLYVIDDSGFRTRVATIETATAQRVLLPRTMNRLGENVAFEVELIGSPVRYYIDPVMVTPGTTLRIAIENALSLSNIMVTN